MTGTLEKKRHPIHRPRQAIKAWHGNDPQYSFIVKKLPPPEEYCMTDDIDRRLQDISKTVTPPLTKASVGLMCSDDILHVRGETLQSAAPKRQAYTYMKSALKHMRSSLLESSREYADVYRSRYLQTLRMMHRVLDTIVESQTPDDGDMQRALTMRHHIETALIKMQEARSLKQYGLDLRLRSFGSRASFLHSQHSDMDLSIQGTFSSSSGSKKNTPLSVQNLTDREKKKILHILASRVGSCRQKYAVQAITRTRVPVVTVRDQKNGFETDICISADVDHFAKSELLLCLNLIDDRFRRLLVLVKTWATRQAIQDASLGRLNSYTLTSLVIFHLQTRTVPILPRIREVLPNRATRGGKVSGDNVIQSMVNGIASWKKQTKEKHGTNQETIVELFLSFLVLLKGLFRGWEGQDDPENRIDVPRWVTRFMRLSTYHGCVYFGETPGEVFTDNVLYSMRKEDLATRQGVIFVEEPFDASDNSARSLSLKCFKSIKNAIQRSLDSFMTDRVDDWGFFVFGLEPNTAFCDDGRDDGTLSETGRKGRGKKAGANTQAKDNGALGPHDLEETVQLLQRILSLVGDDLVPVSDERHKNRSHGDVSNHSYDGVPLPGKGLHSQPRPSKDDSNDNNNNNNNNNKKKKKKKKKKTVKQTESTNEKNMAAAEVNTLVTQGQHQTSNNKKKKKSSRRRVPEKKRTTTEDAQPVANVSKKKLKRKKTAS